MPNFDHFDYLAPFYERFIRPKYPQFLSGLLDLPVNGALLDAGGGTGRVAQFFAGKASQVVVADLSFRMLRKTRGKDRVRAVCASSETAPFPNGAFALIIMVDALHHVLHQHETIGEMWRLLAPGGQIVIEEPDIRRRRVKLIAAGEKLLLMRSHFLSPPQIADLFSFQDAEVDIHNDGPIAFIRAMKKPKLAFRSD